MRLYEITKVTLSDDPMDFGAYVRDVGKLEPIVKIPVAKIVPFEPDAEHETKPNFSANMKKINSVLKKDTDLPAIIVRRYKNGYQVMDGHHRLKAYKRAGKKFIPARIIDPANIKMKPRDAK